MKKCLSRVLYLHSDGRAEDENANARQRKCRVNAQIHGRRRVGRRPARKHRVGQRGRRTAAAFPRAARLRRPYGQPQVVEAVGERRRQQQTKQHGDVDQAARAQKGHVGVD